MTTELLDEASVFEDHIPSHWRSYRIPHEAFDMMSRPERDVQTGYFTVAFEQAQKIERAGVTKDGLAQADNLVVLDGVDKLLKDIHPNLLPEHLMGDYYQSPEARQVYRDIQMTPRQSRDLMQLKSLRLESLHELGEKRAVEASDVVIDEGILGETPYLFQGDGVRNEANLRACFNACFRMVFSAITGEFPHESAVVMAQESVHGFAPIHDEEYLKIFSTPIFKTAFPETEVKVVTLQGADLATIKEIASRVKTKRPDAEVYSVVNIQSELNPRQGDIWHTNVLLGCTENEVIVHDPSLNDEKGMAFRSLSKAYFHRRWAVALNRAHLVIAA